MKTIDRRQQKTRQAIFVAFGKLLETKTYNKITVQEIIDEANIGRSTFYAHFETKDDLLRVLCEELFSHIMSSYKGEESKQSLFADCHNPVSVFDHLLRHLEENDKNIINLLNCESSEIFLRYFKDSLNNLIREQFINHARHVNQDLPEDFLINHISGSFVEMVLWWIKGGMKQSSETLDKYFRAVIEPIL